MKFPGAHSHGTFDGGIGHNLPQQAPDTYGDAELGGRWK
jgi:hypothetical protein